MDKTKMIVKNVVAQNPKAVAYIFENYNIWMDEVARMYYSLCRDCKKKVVANPKLPLEEYCPLCKERAKECRERITRRLSEVEQDGSKAK
jgi:hypothetical protein